MMTSDLDKIDGPIGDAIKRLINETCVRYNGCIIEICFEGYKWGGEIFLTLEDAKETIDRNRKLNIPPPSEYYKTHVQVWIHHADGSETELTDEQKGQYKIGKSPYEFYKAELNKKK